MTLPTVATQILQTLDAHRNFNYGVLLIRDVDARDTCHVQNLISSREAAQFNRKTNVSSRRRLPYCCRDSTLTLFVTQVSADHAHHATTADDFAITANFLDRSADFHRKPLNAD
jgi:hypothetical protein